MMLIDASHPEQTRVVVTEKGRVAEFDVEATTNKQTVGNIYLAKITRVEPSLQAAFVEYGAGRQGFLPFSEIHPDYYQIPVEDRNRLLEEERAYLEEQARQEAEEDEKHFRKHSGDQDQEDHSDIEEVSDEGRDDLDVSENEDIPQSMAAEDNAVPTIETLPDDTSFDVEDELDEEENHSEEKAVDAQSDESPDETPEAENDSGECEIQAERPKLRRPRSKRYKIQEVIKKRQILLVQVVKGERGNKGASLTTYLSLAGRYCVLMPNTAHGGGISRKITGAKERQNLKKIVGDLGVPQGMGLIIRTAGASRTKTELKRDYEYLIRMWDNVRDLTLDSIAPSLVYEEGSLIKRTIRDVYSKDIQKILVQGDEGYKEAKDFMRMMTPSLARNIQHYKDPLPLFSRYQIEKQLEELTDQMVQLKSGGYLVINQTEALVAIDINSGRATNEFSVEDTALKTNLEAATEIARQLRLRDLAGLVVIDFIDMEDNRNVRAVERRMRDVLKHDRARIQTARISNFGLMEMTRQRLRPAMQEILSVPCPTCKGSGYVVTLETGALRVLRRIFEEVASHKPLSLTAKAEMNIASFILNRKRDMLARFEEAFSTTITIEGSSAFAPSDYEITTEARSEDERQEVNKQAKTLLSSPESDDDDNVAIEEDESNNNGRSRRKKRRRGRSKPQDIEETAASEAVETHEENIETSETSDASDSGEKSQSRGRQRRERRRGRGKWSRNNRFTSDPETYTTESGVDVVIENPVSVLEAIDDVSEDVSEAVVPEEAPASPQDIQNIEENISRHMEAEALARNKEVVDVSAEAEQLSSEANDQKGDQAQMEPELVGAEPESEQPTQPEDPKPARKGWWRSRFGV